MVLNDYVASHVPDVLNHNGFAPLDHHLKGVQAVLRFWESDEHIVKAGLFHSIYGTEGFQGFTLDLKERNNIRELIGEKAERMVFNFCMIDRATLDKTIMEWTVEDVKKGNNNNSNKSEGSEVPVPVYELKARPELGRFDILMTKEEWVDFLELTLADWLEQVEGASWKSNPLYYWDVGMSYSHRRLAFEKMSVILLGERNKSVAREMYEAVMATESEATKVLHQPRTPPMTEAAAAALSALRANGEDIPEDLSPQLILV
mmetsp:Transcript_31798/g.45206  ORF Transcript_31798/g.45206 Transcript_31798/m.45206 type:complete len:260 (+) Transcript_31798:3-782(+)